MKKISGGLTRHLKYLEEVQRRKNHGANGEIGISEPRVHRKTIIATSNGYRIAEHIQGKS